LTQDAGEMAVDIAHEDCTDPNDILIQTAMYESAPFHLVEGPDGTVPIPTASAPASSDPPASTPASTSADHLTTHEQGSVKGASLGYLEYLPPDYEDKAQSPLLVFLHGSGESGNGTTLDLSRLTGTAIPFLVDTNRWPDDRPFVVLMPQHADAPGSPCFTAAEIDAFMAFAIDHYDIDPKRVYLTGLSCGAIGMWNYLGAHADEVLAAAVPIAGYGIGAFDRRGCALGELPIWAFHGAEDDSVVLRGDVYPMESLQACTDPKAVDARLTVYPDSGHDVWSRTYDTTAGYDIYSWMLSHTK
jgi:predicted peptidase